MVPKKDNNPNIPITVFYRHTKKTSDNTFLAVLSESKNKNKQLSSMVTSIMTQ